jgi:hypothetical protein
VNGFVEDRGHGAVVTIACRVLKEGELERGRLDSCSEERCVWRSNRCAACMGEGTLMVCVSRDGQFDRERVRARVRKKKKKKQNSRTAAMGKERNESKAIEVSQRV